MVKIYSGRGKKKPSLTIDEVTDSLITFSIRNNDPFMSLTITSISLVHKTALDHTSYVLISSEGKLIEYTTPRENIGTYIIDMSTHETKLTNYSDVIIIPEGKTGSFIFNYKVDINNVPTIQFTSTSLTEMLKTDWIKSKLAVKYVGKGRKYLLTADLKNGLESKESVSFDD